MSEPRKHYVARVLCSLCGERMDVIRTTPTTYRGERAIVRVRRCRNAACRLEVESRERFIGSNQGSKLLRRMKGR
jgi:hypothetical protein